MEELTRTEPRAWDKLPTETPKAYNAFMVYLSLPLAGAVSERRNLPNVAKKLGHESTTTVDGWSSKYNWVERASAYDMTLAATSLTVREVALEEVQQAIVTSLGHQLAVLDDIINRRMGVMLARVQANPNDLDMADLRKLVATIEEKDSLARRMAGMPTAYTTERIEKPDNEDTIFIVSG